jgi:hypothetical protein
MTAAQKKDLVKRADALVACLLALQQDLERHNCSPREMNDAVISMRETRQYIIGDVLVHPEEKP